MLHWCSSISIRNIRWSMSGSPMTLLAGTRFNFNRYISNTCWLNLPTYWTWSSTYTFYWMSCAEQSHFFRNLLHHLILLAIFWRQMNLNNYSNNQQQQRILQLWIMLVCFLKTNNISPKIDLQWSLSQLWTFVELWEFFRNSSGYSRSTSVCTSTSHLNSICMIVEGRSGVSFSSFCRIFNNS